MFNQLDKQPGTTAVDDIFAETDSARTPQGEANIEAQPAGLSAQSTSGDEPGSAHHGPKIKMLLIFLLAAIILGAAAYLVYSKFIASSEETPLPDVNTDFVATRTSSVSPKVDDNVVTPVSEGEDTLAATTTDDTATTTATTTEPIVVPPVTAPIDSDGDSLTDNEELTLGTNSNLIDSDFDGLSDYEEVQVYGTNPLNPDSDGDTFKDGDEVKNGYSPKGEGKLQ